jgi:adenylate cyclase
VTAPESLQSVILSRIGLLREEVKAVLRVAAVMGSVFRKPLLKKAVPESVDLEKVLEELEDRELIYEGRVIPEEEYSFRHVLLQETVYNTLTGKDRVQIHARIADIMETLYPENLDEFAELLAHHFDKAENAAKAVDYLYRAGEKARRACANREAVAHFQRGLELVRRTAESDERSRRELKFIIALGVPLIFTIGNAASEVGSIYQRGYELCRLIGNLDQLYHVQNGLRRFFLARGDIPRSRELGSQMLELAETLDNQIYLARGHMVLAETLLMEGSFSECFRHVQAGLSFCQGQVDSANIDLFGVETLSALISYRGIALTYMGFPRKGLALVDHAVENAEKAGDPINLVVQSLFATMAYFLIGDREKIAELGGKMLRYSSERESELFLAFGKVFLGWADAYAEGSERGIEKIKEGIGAAVRTGSRIVHALLSFAYADALSKAGRLGEAYSVTADSLSLMKDTGELWWKAGTLRLRGEIIVGMGGDMSEAEGCFHESLETARSQAAKIFEIQAATALCRLWQRCGKAQQGHPLLRETYQWFSEGFEFRCLKEAKEMLENRHTMI